MRVGDRYAAVTLWHAFIMLEEKRAPAALSAVWRLTEIEVYVVHVFLEAAVRLCGGRWMFSFLGAA